MNENHALIWFHPKRPEEIAGIMGISGTIFDLRDGCDLFIFRGSGNVTELKLA